MEDKKTTELTKKRTDIKKRIADKIIDRQSANYILKNRKNSHDIKTKLKNKIISLTLEISNLRAELRKLSKIIINRQRSPYNGEYHIRSIVRKKFNKKARELTLAETREYNNYMAKIHKYRQRRKERLKNERLKEMV